MSVSTHLLERAHQLINANQVQNAELVLDAVVRVDPQNIEAWMIYLRIHQCQNDLDWLKERVLKTKELSEADKTELVNYHYYLTKHLNSSKATAVRINPFTHLSQAEKEKNITKATDGFELVDMYDYPVKTIKDIRTRPGRRTLYTTFVLDIVIAAFKAVLRSPLGMRVTAYIKKNITLLNHFARNPKDTFDKFSKWVHFEKSIGITLLAMFFLGVRLIVLSHFLGYGFLLAFIIGSGWWLMSSSNLGTSQNRVYLHENKITLPEIKDAETDQAQKFDKDGFEKKMNKY